MFTVAFARRRSGESPGADFFDGLSMKDKVQARPFLSFDG